MSKTRSISFDYEDEDAAILDWRKTQTRRIIAQLYSPTSQPLWHLLRTEDATFTFTHPSLNHDHVVVKCPYGIPGDFLSWVPAALFYECPPNPPPAPLSRSRPILEIKDVRVEMLQDISEEDAKAEGVAEAEQCDHTRRSCEDIGCYGNGYRATFASLWDSIYAEKGFGWEKNPWVWVIEFEMKP